MTYGELKADFIGQLKHRNATPSQIEGWINKSIIRAQRLLKTPLSEKIVEDTAGPGFTSYPVPNDYLDLINLQVDGRELARVSLSAVKDQIERPTGSTPFYFAREGSVFLIGPVPGEGSKVRLVYSATFSDLSGDNDTNGLLIAAADIVVAGALSFACDFYLDARGPNYEKQFVMGINDLNLKAAQDELTEGAVIAANDFGFDDY